MCDRLLFRFSCLLRCLSHGLLAWIVVCMVAAGAYAQPTQQAPGAAETAEAAGPTLPEPEQATAALPEAPRPSARSGALDVRVRGSRSEAKRLQQSAEAVQVVDLRTAKQQSADFGEVLARTQGVSVQREAGLGSTVRFSLAGLEGDAIRFFVDGVPLELSGFPSIADIPVNLVERVELYRGVVPVRFGVDALGGAVNVITDTSYRTKVGASYQLGSFGTQRATAIGQHRFDSLGLVARGSAYYDFTKNNFKMDVNIPDATGRTKPATIHRNHDRYKQYGGMLEVGVTDKPWARHLSLSGFLSAFEKQYQSDATQTIPFGEVHGQQQRYGTTLRYDVDFSKSLSLALVANYTYERNTFVDIAQYTYNWDGSIVTNADGTPRTRRAGETDPNRKSNLLTWQHSLFGRANLQWMMATGHALRLVVTPSMPWRDGWERVIINPDSRNPGARERRIVSVISGLEYEGNFWDDRLANVLFIKDYWQRLTANEPIVNSSGGLWRDQARTTHKLGVGASTRYRLLPELYAKVSYEYATNLPEPEQSFGDGRLIDPNYDLQPELSHNGNVGIHAEVHAQRVGEFTLDANGFWRNVDNLIMLQGLLRQKYVNVRAARVLGTDAALNWISPGRYVTLNAVMTWQDVRNTSRKGDFGQFVDERVPSQPWLFGNWGARLSVPHVIVERDRVEPFYIGRYVHPFNRSWDNYGDSRYKIRMPTQLTHSVGVTWNFASELANLLLTLEVDNVTDAKLYDFFGSRRPGRAYYMKLTGEFR